ncbi:helicase-exonuclease AddAB subunit AddA [Oscillospiraceae bacterium CM]|nr:helicase-exonuclease AddAB subunit AddA [Oscillospiraceae bacterium CM]
MSKTNFTAQQQAAISSRGTSLLVSAAAGSGKTKVLVERLLSRITDPNDSCDITDFLIITYTRAAAGELRSRILDEIAERLSHDPENRHLRRQSALCYQAKIGTIHAFCADLLREYAASYDLPSDFRVADENESRILKEKALDVLLEEAYDRLDAAPEFAALVDAMSAGRDDKKLAAVILDAHRALMSHPNPGKWVKDQLQVLALMAGQDASETVWGRFLMDDARKKAVYWHGVMESLSADIALYEDLYAAYGASVEQTVLSLEAFLAALDISWDAARAASAIDFPRAKSVKGYEAIKDIRARCRDAMKKAALVFEYTSDELVADMVSVRPVITSLLERVLQFDDVFTALKRRAGVVDFTDLEHLAVRLLTDQETGNPNVLARAVSDRYREIFIDEYQDVSAIQELIFTAVSKDGANIFMVGDVKQSIYRFRLADPSIFLDKYRRYQDLTENTPDVNQRIHLSTNFRSQAAILNAVNFIFENIMSPAFGEMAYTENEALRPGRDGTLCLDAPVELNILDLKAKEDDSEESPEKADAEAAFVAGRIEELLQSGLSIPDGAGGLRPLRYGDIAILLRSVKDKSRYYAEALSKRHIPCTSPAGETFFESFEIALTLALLEIIDNPRQDVPLVTVLKSPIYRFTPDDLAEIRQADRKGDFFTALQKDAETNARSAGFLKALDAFRLMAPELPADRLIWHVAHQTGLFAILAAQRDGEMRRARVLKLIALAARYEASGYQGLYAFLSFLRKLMDSGGDIGEEDVAGGVDAVSIMSIHKSKGLEFPVVILADTTKKFNLQDAARQLLIHADLGVGPKCRDTGRRIEFPTLARLAIAKKLVSEMTAEELRVLYVAMTRAREKLIIVSTFQDADKALQKLLRDAACPVEPQVLETVRNLAGFILLPVLTRPEADCLRAGDSVTQQADGDWVIRRMTWKPVAVSRNDTVAPPEVAFTPDASYIETIREHLAFSYPFQAAAALPSKLTATGLKGRFTDFEAADEAESLPVIGQSPSPRPAFLMENTGLTAAERGIALHLAMQFIDFSRCSSIASVSDELKRLTDMAFLTPKQANAVSPQKILTFFQSQLGRRVLSAEKLYREFKFSLLDKACLYFPAGGDDEILLQGVIDCCFEEKGALFIVDFKTDRVTYETLAKKTALYKPQLDAYARAMRRITGLPVAGKFLYFFALDSAAEITE